MTKEQTIKVLQLLNAFYAGGNNDPREQVIAWHMVMGKYDFEDAMNAVLDFAENDRREYATFPAVGLIVDRIKTKQAEKANAVKNVITWVSYGRGYDSLPEPSKALITEERYNEWLKVNAEEFALSANKYAELLKQKQLRLGTANDRHNK